MLREGLDLAYDAVVAMRWGDDIWQRLAVTLNNPTIAALAHVANSTDHSFGRDAFRSDLYGFPPGLFHPAAIALITTSHPDDDGRKAHLRGVRVRLLRDRLTAVDYTRDNRWQSLECTNPHLVDPAILSDPFYLNIFNDVIGKGGRSTEIVDRLSLAAQLASPQDSIDTHQATYRQHVVSNHPYLIGSAH